MEQGVQVFIFLFFHTYGLIYSTLKIVVNSSSFKHNFELTVYSSKFLT